MQERTNPTRLRYRRTARLAVGISIASRGQTLLNYAIARVIFLALITQKLPFAPTIKAPRVCIPRTKVSQTSTVLPADVTIEKLE